MQIGRDWGDTSRREAQGSRQTAGRQEPPWRFSPLLDLSSGPESPEPIPPKVKHDHELSQCRKTSFRKRSKLF